MDKPKITKRDLIVYVCGAYTANQWHGVAKNIERAR